VTDPYAPPTTGCDAAVTRDPPVDASDETEKSYLVVCNVIEFAFVRAKMSANVS
jgi:hypothetical protein